VNKTFLVVLCALVCIGPGSSLGVGGQAGFPLSSRPSDDRFWAPDSTPAVVTIDIRPGGRRNLVKPSSSNSISVAILGSSKFDVTDVDVTTLRFGPAGAEPVNDPSLQDVNRDGIADLVAYYVVKHAGIACGDEQAPLVGGTHTGGSFEGSDRITTLCRIADPVLPIGPRPALRR